MDIFRKLEDYRGLMDIVKMAEIRHKKSIIRELTNKNRTDDS